MLIMRLTIIYREFSDHARSVQEFVEMLRRRYPDKKPELLDIDTRDGAAEASMRGIMSYPAIVVSSYDGRSMQQWEGLPLPLIDEVASMLLVEQSVSV
jgi:hypothetical protein